VIINALRVLFVGLILGGVGLSTGVIDELGVGEEKAGPRTTDCFTFIREPQPRDELYLTGCRLDLLDAEVSALPRFSGKGKPESRHALLALRPAGRTALGQASVLFESTDPDFISLLRDAQGLSPEAMQLRLRYLDARLTPDLLRGRAVTFEPGADQALQALGQRVSKHAMLVTLPLENGPKGNATGLVLISLGSAALIGLFVVKAFIAPPAQVVTVTDPITGQLLIAPDLSDVKLELGELERSRKED
jgi:hypothetical protein